MTAIHKDLFDRIPPELFRPLVSVRQRLNWRVLVRLYQTLFEEEYLENEYGHDRSVVLDAIEAVVAQNTALWKAENPDDEDAPSTDPHHQIYYSLRDAGWLDEETRGLQKYVSMRPAVSQCLAALIELAEGRPLVVSGALKNMRATILEIDADPTGQADRLVELAKQSGHFARHVNSIRGAIRELYDLIQGNVPAREIVRTFFDEFLREIFIRDYANLKTTDNPLAVRSELLRIVSSLRYDAHKRLILQKGYQDLFPNLTEDEASLRLDQDFSKLEQVFLNVERQLESVDMMKARYERRVDTVIDYATRTSNQLGKKLKALITDLNRQDEWITVRVPLSGQEGLGEARLAQERQPRKPPEPAQVRRREVSRETREKIERERAARQAIQVDDQALQDYLSRQLGTRRTLEMKDLTVESVRDYFCVLHLMRAAHLAGDKPQQFKKTFSQYNLSPTSDWFENTYFLMKNVIITKQV